MYVNNNNNQCPGPSTQSILDPTTVADTIRLASDDAKLTPQAGLCYEVHGESEQKEQITEFFESDPNYTCAVDSEINDETRTSTTQPVESLDDFFARPVKIITKSWAPGTALDDDTIRPWKLWMQNPRVSNRLSNFQNFRGKLHLKFIINGNSFYWGRAFASYTPFTINPYISTVANWLDIPSATLRPHIWIDAATSQAGEMILPFFWADDNFNLLDTDPEQLGRLWLHSLVALQHAQSNTQAVTISIYAWCTDVSLSVPTQTNIAGLVPQAGDEYGSGPISRPANMVAAIAGKLKNAPAIGPYAMATQMAANGMSAVAQLFGYSRPREIEPTKSRRIWQTGDLASTDQPDTAMTLGFTSKQEVTLDPRTVGLGSQDEMCFDYLMSKPTVFAKAQWALNQVVNTALLSIKVTPMVYVTDAYLGGKPGYALTTTGLCSLPFRYWRGSMTYRFQVVASGYHKGRLLFVWEPSNPPVDPILNPPESNVTYSKIVDIAKERDFSITVGWGSSRPSLEVTSPVTDALGPMFSTTGVINGSPNNDNGVLTCYILNPLVTSGDNTSPIEIIMHSSSTDMEVWSPNQDNLKGLTMVRQVAPSEGLLRPKSDDDGPLSPQAGEATIGDTEPGIENAAEETSDLGHVGGSPAAKTFGVFTAGESIRSFRTMLKRYVLRHSVLISGIIPEGSMAAITWEGLGYAYMPGEPIGGIQTPVFDGPFTPHSLIFYCFSGWRGSYRIKLLPVTLGSGSEFNSSSLTISRGNNNSLTDFSFQNYPRTVVGINAIDRLHDHSWNGIQVSNPVQGNVCDFELPYYAIQRYAPISSAVISKELGYQATLIIANGNMETSPSASQIPAPGDREVFAIYREYGAIGEDYNLFFFTGVPPLWTFDPST